LKSLDPGLRRDDDLQSVSLKDDDLQSIGPKDNDLQSVGPKTVIPAQAGIQRLFG
jgi:hypothetical protein